MEYRADDFVEYRADDVVEYQVDDFVAYQVDDFVAYQVDDFVAYPVDDFANLQKYFSPTTSGAVDSDQQLAHQPHLTLGIKLARF